MLWVFIRKIQKHWHIYFRQFFHCRICCDNDNHWHHKPLLLYTNSIGVTQSKQTSPTILRTVSSKSRDYDQWTRSTAVYYSWRRDCKISHSCVLYPTVCSFCELWNDVRSDNQKLCVACRTPGQSRLSNLLHSASDGSALSNHECCLFDFVKQKASTASERIIQMSVESIRGRLSDTQRWCSNSWNPLKVTYTIKSISSVSIVTTDFERDNSNNTLIIL